MATAGTTSPRDGDSISSASSSSGSTSSSLSDTDSFESWEGDADGDFDGKAQVMFEVRTGFRAVFFTLYRLLRGAVGKFSLPRTNRVVHVLASLSVLSMLDKQGYGASKFGSVLIISPSARLLG